MFEAIDKMLSAPYLADYWADEMLPVAGGILATFNEESWGKLRSAWRSKPPTWLLRLAEILRFDSGTDSSRLLIDLMMECDDEVFIQCVDSLLSINPPSDLISAGALARARDLVNNRSGKVTQHLMNRFIGRYESGI